VEEISMKPQERGMFRFVKKNPERISLNLDHNSKCKKHQFKIIKKDKGEI